MPYECPRIHSHQQYEFRLLFCSLFTVVNHSNPISVDNSGDILFWLFGLQTVHVLIIIYCEKDSAVVCVLTYLKRKHCKCVMSVVPFLYFFK